MLDFSLSEEHQAIQRLARDFAQQEIKPVARQLDQDEEETTRRLLAKAAGLGITGLIIPEAFGGSAKGGPECTLVLEELAAADGGLATALGANWLAQTPILLAATPEQRAKFLPPLASAPECHLACLAMTEPTGGSDIENPAMNSAGIHTLAKPHGDGFVIDGIKRFPSNAGIASLYAVIATVDRSQGDRGSCMLLVPAGTPGLSFGKPEDKMGMRADRNCDIIFDGVWVPRDHLLGKIGDGARLLRLTLAFNRAGAGSIAVGMARGAYEIALEYSRTRVQGGMPLFRQPMIAAKLADAATSLDAARLLCWRAAWYNATHRPPSIRYASMAKVFASDMAMQVISDCIQIMGSYGYMKEYLVEKYLRDAKIVQIYLGANEICRLDIGDSL